MKTRNLFIGLGIAAGAALTIAALRNKKSRVREFVTDKFNSISGKSDNSSKKEDIDYV